MSFSNEGKPPIAHSKRASGVPKQKSHRACDFCRQRKARCNGYEMPGRQCSKCVRASLKCTYVNYGNRAPYIPYVNSLEKRVANMEKLFSLVLPDVDTNRISTGQLPNTKDNSFPNQMAAFLNPASLSTVTATGDSPDSNGEDGSESEDEPLLLAVVDKREAHHEIPYFYGKSSNITLAQDVLDLKKELRGTEEKMPNPHMPECSSWVYETLRPTFLDYRFPEPDLLSSLIELYFLNLNSFYPLLHRPTFETSLADGLHKRDSSFGASVLLVCAIGCRFSDDPRVSHEEKSVAGLPTCWDLFHQVKMLRSPGILLQSIYDLHVNCLAAIFMDDCATLQASWVLAGVGLRLVQDAGAHRRKFYGSKPSVDNELWKRAFWVLLLLDRNRGCLLGRPSTLQDEDFDLDLPIECDDEYWTHPEQAFKQPTGKPSYMTFFILLIKLDQILAFALRTIYSTKKSKAALDETHEKWENSVVTALDSAMNSWADSVPDCLRLDPNKEDITLFKQSILLYCSYYDIQIIIHRPYPWCTFSRLSRTSMAICTNAARSCCHLLEHSRERLGHVLKRCVRSIFTSSVILLLDLWSGKSLGRSVDVAAEMEDVHKCQSLLQQYERPCGVLGDTLTALLSVGDGPFFRGRAGIRQKGLLFMPNFSCLGIGSSCLPPMREHSTETVGILTDSEELTQLPPYVKQLFHDYNPAPSSSLPDPAELGSEPSVPQNPPPADRDQTDCTNPDTDGPNFNEPLTCGNSVSECDPKTGSSDAVNDGEQGLLPYIQPQGESAVDGDAVIGWDALDDMWSAAITVFDDWDSWASHVASLNKT